MKTKVAKDTTLSRTKGTYLYIYIFRFWYAIPRMIWKFDNCLYLCYIWWEQHCLFETSGNKAEIQKVTFPLLYTYKCMYKREFVKFKDWRVPDATFKISDWSEKVAKQGGVAFIRSESSSVPYRFSLTSCQARWKIFWWMMICIIDRDFRIFQNFAMILKV